MSFRPPSTCASTNSSNQALLAEFTDHKQSANDTFKKGEYTSAIEKYNQALSSCPNYLSYERAVIKSNIAACHLQLQEWKECSKAASEAIVDLDKLDPAKVKAKLAKEKAASEKTVREKASKDNDVEVTEVEKEEEVEEIISSGAEKAEDTSETAQREKDIERIRSKALLRRAKARSELGGWSNLAGAQEDYTELSKMSFVTPQDKKVVLKQLRDLPPRVKLAQEVEMAEMMGKLKGLGNGILKPFGLSTDNFQMTKDPKTGGYNMNFNQGGM